MEHGTHHRAPEVENLHVADLLWFEGMDLDLWRDAVPEVTRGSDTTSLLSGWLERSQSDKTVSKSKSETKKALLDGLLHIVVC